MLFFAPNPVFKDAPCADLTPAESDKLFFSLGNGYKHAQKLCDTCPQKAKDACLALALDHESPGDERFGVYGGMTARERKRIYG